MGCQHIIKSLTTFDPYGLKARDGLNKPQITCYKTPIVFCLQD